MGRLALLPAGAAGENGDATGEQDAVEGGHADEAGAGRALADDVRGASAELCVPPLPWLKQDDREGAHQTPRPAPHTPQLKICAGESPTVRCRES